MLKLLKIFAWLLLTLIVLVAGDQLLVRVPLDVPGVTQAQTFYVDFRARLFGLVGIDQPDGGAGKSIEQVIEASQPTSTEAPKAAQRYLYVDDSGVLNFADSLQLVPERYRKDAQPLEE